MVNLMGYGESTAFNVIFMDYVSINKFVKINYKHVA